MDLAEGMMEGMMGSNQEPMAQPPKLDPAEMRQMLLEHAEALGISPEAVRQLSDEQVVQIFQQVQESIMQSPAELSMDAYPQDGRIPMEQPSMGYGGYLYPELAIGPQTLPIKSPDETLEEDRLRWARAAAQAKNDKMVQLMQGVADVATLIGAGASAYQSGKTQGLANAVGEVGSHYATGGNIPVEVEGNEMFETPQGDVGTFEGPSHEDGGVQTALPAGSKVYSQRVQEQGESMAQRKRTRELRLLKAEKELERRPADPVAKKTLKRIQEINAEEDARDMEVQSLLHEATQRVENGYRTGGVVLGNYLSRMPKPKFGLESPYGYQSGDEYLPELPEDRARLHYKLQGMSQDAAMKKAVMDGSPIMPTRHDTRFANRLAIASNPALGGNDQKYMDVVRNQPGKSTKDMSKEDEARRKDEKSAWERAKEGVKSFSVGAGDVVKAIGNVHTLNELQRNQAEYEASQTPFKNQYAQYGNDALSTIDAQKAFVQQQLDSQLLRLRLQSNASKERLRNTAGSVNTLRALDIANEEQYQQAVAQAHEQAQKQMQAIHQQEAALLNDRDAKRMAGEDDRDLNQREQEAQNFKNRDRNIRSEGKVIENVGSMINNAQKNHATQGLLNRYSKYGIQASGSTGDVATVPIEEVPRHQDDLYSTADKPAMNAPSQATPSKVGPHVLVKDASGNPLPADLDERNDRERKKQEQLRMEEREVALDSHRANTERTRAETQQMLHRNDKPAEQPDSGSATGMFPEPLEPGKTRLESMSGETLAKRQEELAAYAKRITKKNYKLKEDPKIIAEDFQHAMESGGEHGRIARYLVDEMGLPAGRKPSVEQMEFILKCINDFLERGPENTEE